MLTLYNAVRFRRTSNALRNVLAMFWTASANKQYTMFWIAS